MKTFLNRPGQASNSELYDDVVTELDKISTLVEVALNANLSNLPESVLFSYFAIMGDPVAKAKNLIQVLC